MPKRPWATSIQLRCSTSYRRGAAAGIPAAAGYALPKKEHPGISAAQQLAEKVKGGTSGGKTADGKARFAPELKSRDFFRVQCREYAGVHRTPESADFGIAELRPPEIRHFSHALAAEILKLLPSRTPRARRRAERHAAEAVWRAPRRHLLTTWNTIAIKLTARHQT